MFLITVLIIVYENKMSDEKEVLVAEYDYTGMPCSEIRLLLTDMIKQIKIGQIIKFTTDEPDAIIYAKKWCRMHKQELFLSEEKGTLSTIYIKRLE